MSLRELSEDTGGFAVVNANDFATAFDRIVRDNSSYYAMAYYPPTEKAGKFHKIEVRVRRPDVRVRARQGYVTPKPPGAAAEKSARRRRGGRDEEPDDAGDSRRARQPAAGQRADDEGVCGAFQRHGAECVGAPRRRDARARSAPRRQRQGRRDVSSPSTRRERFAGTAPTPLAMTLQPETKARVAATGLRLLNRVELPPGGTRFALPRTTAAAATSGRSSTILTCPILRSCRSR